MWMVEYAYDDQTELRDEFRPEHRAYLEGLLNSGRMFAYGRYTDGLEPGALLIYLGETMEAVEDLIAKDPFVREGLVPHHRIRMWDGNWSGSSV